MPLASTTICPAVDDAVLSTGAAAGTEDADAEEPPDVAAEGEAGEADADAPMEPPAVGPAGDDDVPEPPPPQPASTAATARM
jgi:hypothetical protein